MKRRLFFQRAAHSPWPPPIFVDNVDEDDDDNDADADDGVRDDDDDGVDDGAGDEQQAAHSPWPQPIVCWSSSTQQYFQLY